MRDEGLTSKIAAFIALHGLMDCKKTYVVALSGGPDSVALLLVLRELGYQLEAAHCNFHLRGAESDRDENFCRLFCDRRHVRLHVMSFDTIAYADAHGVSIEMAARELRYQWFGRLCREIHADGVCVAHHLDDQVETILLNLVRGTGLRGLLGMRPKNGLVIRPMLGATRAQIMNFLKSREQDYVVDSTNLEDAARRNIVRLDLMPVLERINSNARQNILRMSDNLANAKQLVDAKVDEDIRSAMVADGIYDMTAVFRSVAPEYILWSVLSPCGFNRAQLMEIVASHGKGRLTWYSATHVLALAHGCLYIYSHSEWEGIDDKLKINQPGTYVTNKTGSVLVLSLMSVDQLSNLQRSNSMATLDAEKVVFPLVLRPVLDGDRFVPYGMRGSKLVSKQLRDSKLSPLHVRRQLVLADALGRIVWVVGVQVAQPFAITSTTRRMIVITCSSLK